MCKLAIEEAIVHTLNESIFFNNQEENILVKEKQQDLELEKDHTENQALDEDYLYDYDEKEVFDGDYFYDDLEADFVMTPSVRCRK